MTVRSIALSSLLFLAACATPTQLLVTPGFLGSESATPATATAGSSTVGSSTGWASTADASTATSSSMANRSPLLPKRGDGIGSSYTILKAGVFMPAGDLEDLDDGTYFEGTFGRELLPFLAVEGQIGYLSTDGQFGATSLDLWAIPLFVNVRLSVPILIFEPYAGVGIGGIYADYEAGSFSSSDFVLAYNAFVGLEVGLGSLAVGAEYKYVQSEDTKDDFSIEGGIASLFVSIPF